MAIASRMESWLNFQSIYRNTKSLTIRDLVRTLNPFAMEGTCIAGYCYDFMCKISSNQGRLHLRKAGGQGSL